MIAGLPIYDLKSVNPNGKHMEDTRTHAQLLELIAAKGREAGEALAELDRLRTTDISDSKLIAAAIGAGTFKTHDDCSPELLIRIQQGLFASPHTPQKVKTFAAARLK